MAETTNTESTAAERNTRKSARGYVVSDKMDKTVVVEVEERMKHRLYGKVMRKSVKYKVHDEENTAGVGDLVLVAETRPLSAAKRRRLVEIIERAKSPTPAHPPGPARDHRLVAGGYRERGEMSMNPFRKAHVSA